MSKPKTPKPPRTPAVQQMRSSMIALGYTPPEPYTQAELDAMAAADDDAPAK